MLCLHVYLYTPCVQCPRRPEEGTVFHRIGVRDGWEPPCVCAGNRTGSLWKNSWSLSHLSSPYCMLLDTALCWLTNFQSCASHSDPNSEAMHTLTGLTGILCTSLSFSEILQIQRAIPNLLCSSGDWHYQPASMAGNRPL